MDYGMHCLTAAILLIGLGSLTHAQISQGLNGDDGLCTDLARFACAPGSYNDGTGVGEIATDTQGEVERILLEEKPKIAKQFKSALEDPNNIYFRQLALSALGLSYAPQCRSSRKADENQCIDNLASGLADIAGRNIFNMMGETYSYGQRSSLKQLGLLIENATFQNTLKPISEEVEKRLYNPALLQKIQTKIFPEVKRIIIENIKHDVKDPKTAALLVDKIKGISWDGTSCGENSYQKSVSTLLIANAMYNPIRNSFTICNGWLLSNRSEFSIVEVMAHELSHSIDPCNIAKGPRDFSFQYTKGANQSEAEAEYPFHGLIKCLRSKKSVHAIRNDNNSTAYYSPYPSYYPVVKKLHPQRTTRFTPNPVPSGGLYPNYPSMACPNCVAKKEVPFSFCTGDQITESFADWMAYETLPKYMAKEHPSLTKQQFQIGYGNAFKSACGSLKSPYGNVMGGYGSFQSFDVHPESADRVNKLLLANPLIRSQMGCPAKDTDVEYCSSNSAPSTIQAEPMTSSQLNSQGNSQ